MTVTSIAAISDFVEANQVVMDVIRDHGAAMSAPVYAAITAYRPSPVDRMVYSAEALYAGAKAAGGTDQEGMAVACAKLADFAVANAFHELGGTDRGLKMSGSCRRLVGLGSQAVGEDPEPLDAFADV